MNRRRVNKGLGSLGVLATLLLAFPIAAAAGVFAATLTASGTTFSAATLQLRAGSCYSTGTGAGGSVSANSSTCATGSPVPANLSTTSSSATTTLSSVGRTDGSAATVSSISCGVAQLADTGVTAKWGGSANNTARPLYGVTYQATGPLSTTAITLDGTAGWAETETQYTDPETFTILAWFKTSTATGSLIGFSNSQTAPVSAGSDDRMLWIDPTGHVVWGVYNTLLGVQEVTSSSTYANGAWHFVAASIGLGGQTLYVDGALAGSSINTSAQSGYSGWWSIGLSSVTKGGWSDPPTSAYFTGSLAQVAVIPSQLTAGQVTTLNGDNTLSTFTAGVNALSPVDYWALNDSGSVPYEGSVTGVTSTTTLLDASGNANTGSAQGGVTLGAAGPTTLGGAGISLDGTTGYVQTAKSYTNPNGFSAVAWFNTTSASGGTVLAFTNVQGNTTPASWDRLLWLDNAGKVVWGVFNGVVRELTSPSAYKDGNWHMVVAEIGASGQQLWVDGVEVASNGAVVSSANYTGYWHLGWGYESTWADPPTSNYFAGSLSQVAIVPSQLTSSQITNLHSANSASSLAAATGSLAPTSYWPLADTPTNLCGTTEVTVQQTVGATNTCVYPSGAGACAAPTAANLLPFLGVRTITAPTSSTPVTIKVTMQLSSASAVGILGLHELAAITFGTTKSSTLWSAGITYSYAASQL